MANDLIVPREEIIAIFALLEEINHLFHQPMRYRDPDIVEQFAMQYYPEIHRLYYDVVSKWLPADIRDDIERR